MVRVRSNQIIIRQQQQYHAVVDANDIIPIVINIFFHN